MLISQHSFLTTMVGFQGIIGDLGDHVIRSYHRNQQIQTRASSCNSQIPVVVLATLSLEIPVLPHDHHVMRSHRVCLPDVLLSLSASAICSYARVFVTTAFGFAPRKDRNWSACTPEKGKLTSAQLRKQQLRIPNRSRIYMKAEGHISQYHKNYSHN
jgi:hypothetical protein